MTTTQGPLNIVDFGQYRITVMQDGTYVEVWVAETAKRRGHWRLVTGLRKARILAEADSRLARRKSLDTPRPS
jgi:hypothetical protein